MEDYNYSVGRVRALEARMLTAAQLARMAAAPSLEAAFAVLTETPYAENLPKLKTPFDFEELCVLELASLKNLMDYLAPQNKILAALFKKHDYLTIKIYVRNFFLQKPKETYETNDKKLLEIIDKAKTEYKQNKDPQNVDILLDKHYFSYLKQICSNSPSPLIRNLVNHKIDLTNIKTLLRTQEHKKLETALLEPGFIDKDILVEIHGKSLPDIASRLNFTPYFPGIAAGLEYYDKNKSFYLLEKSIDDYIINQFRKAKYLSSGIEPLVGFYLAKEAEIKTIRFILICKKNHIESKLITERLRVSY